MKNENNFFNDNLYQLSQDLSVPPTHIQDIAKMESNTTTHSDYIALRNYLLPSE